MNFKHLFIISSAMLLLPGCSFQIGDFKFELNLGNNTQQGKDSETGGGQGQGGQTTTHDGLSVNTAFTAEEAYDMMVKAGEGVIVNNKEYYVTGTFDAGTSVNTKYEYPQWYGTTTIGTKVFKVSGATNDSGVSVNEDEGAMDGMKYIVKGFMELYNGEYKVGFLPATASPTGSKYVPSIVSLNGNSSGSGGTSSDDSGSTGGGTQGNSDGLTSVVKLDFSLLKAVAGSGSNNRLTDDELKSVVQNNANNSGKVTNVSGENVYQGYIPSKGDTSIYKDGVSGCLRTGGSSKTGKITLTLSENVVGIKIVAHAWSVKETFTDQISVNSSSTFIMTSDYDDYEFKFNSTSTVTINTTNRAFIRSIELFK